MSPRTLLAVDGNSLLHRSFHASARSGFRTPDGRPMWAVRGLLSQLVAAVDRVCADAVVVGFDDRASSVRKERWPTYKAHRDAKPESLEEQLDTAIDVLRATRHRGRGARGSRGRRRAGQRGGLRPDGRRPHRGGDLRPGLVRADRRAHQDAADPQRRRRRVAAARPAAAGDGDRRAARAVPRLRRAARRRLGQPAGVARHRPQDGRPAAGEFGSAAAAFDDAGGDGERCTRVLGRSTARKLADPAARDALAAQLPGDDHAPDGAARPRPGRRRRLPAPGRGSGAGDVRPPRAARPDGRAGADRQGGVGAAAGRRRRRAGSRGRARRRCGTHPCASRSSPSRRTCRRRSSRTAPSCVELSQSAEKADASPRRARDRRGRGAT